MLQNRKLSRRGKDGFEYFFTEFESFFMMRYAEAKNFPTFQEY